MSTPFLSVYPFEFGARSFSLTHVYTSTYSVWKSIKSKEFRCNPIGRWCIRIVSEKFVQMFFDSGSLGPKRSSFRLKWGRRIGFSSICMCAAVRTNSCPFIRISIWYEQLLKSHSKTCSSSIKTPSEYEISTIPEYTHFFLSLSRSAAKRTHATKRLTISPKYKVNET